LLFENRSPMASSSNRVGAEARILNAVAQSITFLGETTIDAACSLLNRQSEELFGGDGSSSNGNASRTTYTDQFSNLYAKCKAAQDVIMKADEDGILRDPGSVNPSPAAAYRGGHGKPELLPRGHPMPRGPPLSGGQPQTKNSSLMGAPMHRPGRSSQMQRTKSLIQSGNFSAAKKPAMGGHANSHTSAGVGLKRQRSLSSSESFRANSNSLGVKRSSGGKEGEKAQPPPEVAAFLAALNSRKTNAKAARMNRDEDLDPAEYDNEPSASSQKEKAADMIKPPSTGRKRPAPPPTSSRRTPRPKTESAENAEFTTPAVRSNMQVASEGSRSTRSSRRGPATTPIERVYDIGETVYVKAKVDGKLYGAIIKNVDCFSDPSRGEGGVSMKYEVEYSDGEIENDVDPDDITSDDEEI